MKVVLSAPYPRVDAKFVRYHGIMAPLGILYIAANLRKHGHDVRIIDGYGERLSPQEATDAILAADPEVIGLGSSTSNYLTTKEMAVRLKTKTKVPIVLGGVHASAMPEMSLRSGVFDYLILGEGEKSFKELLEAIDAGARPEFPGVAYRENDHYVSFAPELVDLDSLPSKAWDLVDVRNYHPSPAGRRHLPAISSITARGCSGHCTYCALNNIFKRKVRYDPIENVRHELEYLREHGIRDVNLWDSAFTHDREKAIERCGILKELGFSWNCSARVDQVDRELIEIMADSGCYLIGYGVESGSLDTLSRLGREDLDLETVERTAEDTRRAGIQLKTYVMLGEEYETREDIEQTFKFVKKLRADFVSFCITKPYPGTELFRRLNKEWSDDDFEDYHHYSSQNTVCRALSGKELEKLSASYYRKYYLRPQYMWDVLTRMRSFSDFAHLVRSFREAFLDF
jgi:radical SAM superfamily enzyme YgiQ (UPF0313 family)